MFSGVSKAAPPCASHCKKFVHSGRFASSVTSHVGVSSLFPSGRILADIGVASTCSMVGTWSTIGAVTDLAWLMTGVFVVTPGSPSCLAFSHARWELIE